MLFGCSVSNLAAKVAFFPPNPATYSVKKEGSGNNGRLVASRIPRDRSMNVHIAETKRGNKNVAFYLRKPYAKLTVLYSRGNAVDLGQLYNLFVQLKLNLRVHLMGYDYSGYGASSGKPSKLNTYADMEAVYQCLQTEYRVNQNINKIKKVKCPVLVIHGTDDDVVNWHHGNGPCKLSRDPYEPLWI